MEEKERYSYHSYYKKRICDNETNKIISVIETLNQQDKRIKELENKYLLNEIEYQDYCSFKRIEPEIRGCLDREKILAQENKQLKQQLKDTEESYNNTMRYLNKIRSKLLNLHKKI